MYLRKHNKSFEVHRGCPGDVAPCAKVVARVDDNGQDDAASNAINHGERLLFFDGWVTWSEIVHKIK